MSTPADADHWFTHHGIADIVRISDPDKTLYRAFGLGQASLAELVHPRVWWPWIRTAVLGGYGAGRAGPNWRQLTGVFVLHRGQVVASVHHRNSAARPDYLALLRGLNPGITIR